MQLYIAKHSNNFAHNNQALPIVPVLTKIKIKPGKSFIRGDSKKTIPFDMSLRMYST